MNTNLYLYKGFTCVYCNSRSSYNIYVYIYMEIGKWNKYYGYKLLEILLHVHTHTKIVEKKNLVYNLKTINFFL